MILSKKKQFFDRPRNIINRTLMNFDGFIKQYRFIINTTVHTANYTTFLAREIIETSIKSNIFMLRWKNMANINCDSIKISFLEKFLSETFWLQEGLSW